MVFNAIVCSAVKQITISPSRSLPLSLTRHPHPPSGVLSKGTNHKSLRPSTVISQVNPRVWKLCVSLMRKQERDSVEIESARRGIS